MFQMATQTTRTLSGAGKEDRQQGDTFCVAVLRVDQQPILTRLLRPREVLASHMMQQQPVLAWSFLDGGVDAVAVASAALRA
jgi:hypothetical protein